jgi:hypothetical protein
MTYWSIYGTLAAVWIGMAAALITIIIRSED